MLTGPPAAPLCRCSPRIPSVSRTVKDKASPNLGRVFFTCAKDEGKKGDPNTRCNFFAWSDAVRAATK